MSIHVCECEHNGRTEYHLRYPGMSEQSAQNIADKINSGALDAALTQPAQPAEGGEAREFFAYHSDMGVEFFNGPDAEAAAKSLCDENLKLERAEAISTDEWADDRAESIRWGVVLGRAKFFENPGQEGEDSGDYKMVGYTAPPASQEQADELLRAKMAHAFDNIGHSIMAAQARLLQVQLQCKVENLQYQPASQEPMLNGLTEAETSATASVMGLTASQEQAKWCEYVAGMVDHWVRTDEYAGIKADEDRCTKAIAGIIERRLWALKREASQEQAQQPSIAGFKVVLDPTMPPDRFKFVQQPSGGEVVAYKVNWPGVDSVGMRRFYGADEWEASRGTIEFLGGVALPLTLATPKPEPMTDDEMWALWNAQGIDDMTQHEAIAFARAVEAHHGITKGEA